MTEVNIWEGITIGATGGAAAGIAIYIVKGIWQKFNEWREGSIIYKWLNENTEDEIETEFKFRSTRTISSWTNLTEDRVRFLCNRHKKIYKSTGKEDNLWSIYVEKDRDASGNPRNRRL